MASLSSSSSSKVSLKLLIDTKEKRVLLAEASKEFIDFLFNLLRLPVGTVTRLLTKKGMVGCLGKLYESIENLSDNYFNNPTQDKNILLKPSAPLLLATFYLNATQVKDASGGEGGFVKGVVTYTVMDDLEVRPMSTISTVALISKFKVKDIASLQEKVVELGMEEGIKLLKASLQCKNVLTSVFLENMAE
ncbi:hypothetical protein K1719_000727 [Acacia pycnantha]|nr:hypothetical protein K1719_000727 [Acacia pycnantha]